MSTPPSSPAPAVVYVVTDLGAPAEPGQAQPVNPYAALWGALQPLIALGLVVVPVLASTALLIGLLLGWSPPVLAVAAVLGLPVLIGLTDLLGARLGWPPLAWTAARIAARRRPAPGPTKETLTDD